MATGWTLVSCMPSRRQAWVGTEWEGCRNRRQSKTGMGTASTGLGPMASAVLAAAAVLKDAS